MNKKTIYLADLTHTGQSIASNVFPLAIGLIASYVEKMLPDQYEIELFKYPDDLSAACQRKLPDVIGFSNYSWNLNLSIDFAKKIKERSPSTIVVFGGPNYGLTIPEMSDFWRRYSCIDFYIVKEGEKSFVELLQRLSEENFSTTSVKSGKPGSNWHYQYEGKLVQGELAPRFKGLDEIGSPYLMGKFDKFFDNVLIPMIHTTRGCPFACTFCTEGNDYYSKVAQRTMLKEELTYIASRVQEVPDILISDANFGMFKQDREKAELIASTQSEFGWPKRILVSTGKNQKERVLEVASILKGSLSVAASLQTTNIKILDNIKRANISSDALSEIVKNAEKAEATTFTEIILGLPGDTLEAHTQSLKSVVDAGFNIVRMYQMILLPQTEMAEPESRIKYQLQTKFRINPRSFGRYDFDGESFYSVEFEEICIANNTLSYEDYLHCRELNLSIEIFHNSGMFKELHGFFQFLKISWFDLIHQTYLDIRKQKHVLNELYDCFREGSTIGLWDSEEALLKSFHANPDKIINNTNGTNEMVMGKALAVFKYQEALHIQIYKIAKRLIQEKGLWCDMYSLYLDDLMQISLMKKNDFLALNKHYTFETSFDLDEIQSENYLVDPAEYFENQKNIITIQHSKQQTISIQTYIKQYGSDTIEGKGRILMRAPIHELYRTAEIHHGSTLQ